jgi:tripartite-type tricarboxylate transporter receptor subunit TctC
MKAAGGTVMSIANNARAWMKLSSAVLIFALGGFASVSHAEDYPNKPVRIILPYGPGGVADVTTRLVAQKLSERLGQNFFIDNRPGAGGIIAAKATLASPADGYTLTLTGNASAISESLFKSLPFNALKDFTSVSTLAEFEMLLATKAGSQLDSLAKVVAYAKEHPGKLNFGTVATGSTQNLSAEMFRMVTGAKAVIVVYKTTPDLVAAIIRGDVDVGFDYLAAFRPMIVSKQIRIIATAGERRNPELKNVPTAKESGYPDYVVTSWNALSAPNGIPKEIVTKLNNEIQAVLKLPEIQQRMSALGMEPMIGPPEKLTNRLKADTVKWAKVIEAAGIPKR